MLLSNIRVLLKKYLGILIMLQTPINKVILLQRNAILRGVTRKGKGGTITLAPIHYGALNHCRGAELLLDAPKSPDNVASTFINKVNLPSKELRFEHRGAKRRPWGRRFDQGGAEFVICPGRHITSLHPWSHYIASYCNRLTKSR